MAFVLSDRVKESTSSPGTGTATLLGAATGYQSFSAGIGANNTTYYVIADQNNGANWEVGFGTIGAGGTTLARTTVLASSNSNSLVNFSTGTQDVWCDYPAKKAVYLDSSNNVSALGTVASGTWNGTAIGAIYGGTGGTSAQAGMNNLAGAVTSGSYLRGNGTNVVMSTIQATDVPTLNQNTTGTASNVTGVVAIANGGTGKTTATEAYANLIGYTTTATSVTAVTLTASSSYQQFFTGSVAQTVTLPVASTLSLGWAVEIVNNSSATMTVNSSGGNLVLSIGAGLTGTISCILNSGTTAASWHGEYSSFDNITGSGSVVFSTSPTLVTPILGTPQSGNFSTGTFTWPTFNQNTTGTASNVTGTVALANGGTGKTTAPAAMANLMGFTSTATAAGTTVLNNTSSVYQVFTGSTTQTITLPVTSTLQTGWYFHIVNNSTGTLTINSSGGNLVSTVIPNTTVMTSCIGTTLTTAADWEYGYTDFSNITGTGSVVMNTSPTLVTPALGTPASGNLANCTFPTLNQNTTGTASNVTGTVAVGNGGTGSTSLTANNVLLGNGTSALQVVAPSTSGNVLTSNGTTWTSATPTAITTSSTGWTATSTAPFFLNATTVSQNYTSPANYNLMSAGPVTINTGITVTIDTTGAWVIV